MAGAIEGDARARAVGGHERFDPAHGGFARAASKGIAVAELRSAVVACQRAVFVNAIVFVVLIGCLLDNGECSVGVGFYVLPR